MKKYIIVALLHVIAFNGFSQTEKNVEWETISEDSFTLQHPKTWELDKSGAYNTNLMLFTELSSEADKFRDNINVMTQDLSKFDIDLSKFVNISEGQISSMMKDGKIISSERIKGENEHHVLIFSGTQDVYSLKFEQHYYVIGKKAYVLTLTCEVDAFDNYKKIGEQILNSFKLK
jgi:hypothetical protein